MNFCRLVHLNWLAKILIEGGPRPLVININVIANCCCTRDCCTQKMLKETETEETIGFVSLFLSLVAFQLQRAGPPCLRQWFYDYQTS